MDDFLKGTWADVSKTFVYATSSSARSTQLLNKVEALSKGLGERSIAFEVWDQEVISEKLKGYPEVVHDFFGKPWVKAFCGDAAASKLDNRLDAREMSELRKELAGVYATTFGLADPGYAGIGLNEVRRVELLERFVTPDLVSATRQTASYPYNVAVESEAARRTPTTRHYECPTNWPKGCSTVKGAFYLPASPRNHPAGEGLQLEGVVDRPVPRVNNLHVPTPITTLAIDSLRVGMQSAEKDRHHILVFPLPETFPPNGHALSFPARSRHTP